MPYVNSAADHCNHVWGFYTDLPPQAMPSVFKYFIKYCVEDALHPVHPYPKKLVKTTGNIALLYFGSNDIQSYCSRAWELHTGKAVDDEAQGFISACTKHAARFIKARDAAYTFVRNSC